MTTIMRRLIVLFGIVAIGATVAGCDKCGNSEKFNVPHACGENAAH